MKPTRTTAVSYTHLSVQVEEYREDGLYLEGIVKTEDLHCFEGYLF